MQTELTASQHDALQSDLEIIEQSVNELGVPVRHSDLFFELKSHIDLVRQGLTSLRAAPSGEKRKVG